MRDIIYFKITGGPIKETWLAFKEEKQKAIAACRAFADEFNCEQVYAGSRGASRVTFKGEKPEGWVKTKRGDGYVPGKKLKDVAARMESLRVPDSKDLWALLSGENPPMIVTAGYLYEGGAGYEEIGDVGVLQLTARPQTSKQDNLNNGDDGEPWWTPIETEFCTRLKLSEYHALKGE